ncbi:MAG: flagellar basal body rod protein FlgF [Gammaproteobacteria bacterium]|nr:MAG: flagellar basal body rod protein FlgF [Gammaproteobacteria bacterium]
MDRLLFVAASGLRQILQAQEVNANNLANASTVGFQADLTRARALYLNGPYYPDRVFSATESPSVDFSRGGIERTGRALDVAVQGEGWIAVQAPDGSEAYTRRGDLRISPEGLLETGNGLPVLGDGGPILVPPHEKLEIGSDGTVSVRPLGQGAEGMAVIGRIKLVAARPGELVKGPDGLLRRRDGQPAEPSAEIRLATGALETSNVSLVQSLTEMIALARRFEAQVKLLESARRNDEASSRLMNIQG